MYFGKKLHSSWLHSYEATINDFTQGKRAGQTFVQAKKDLLSYLGHFRKVIKGQAAQPIPFQLLPQWQVDLMPSDHATPATISGGMCYPTYTATSEFVNATHILITISPIGQPSSILCSEQLLFIAGGVRFHFEFFNAGASTKTLLMDVSDVMSDSAANWFLQRHGVRSYIIATDGILSTIGSLIDTVTMLSGFATVSPPASVLDANLNFINNYIQGGGNIPRMGPLSVPRPANNSVMANFSDSNIQSGDLLMLLRRDGIDPMIGWGEGSLAGHSAIAIRTGEGVDNLQVCESTTQDGYWPDNGIQCHDWLKWVQLCEEAGQNVVLVPLSKGTRGVFNTSKALQFFAENKGLDYGYSSFLFGWLDTETQNFPCTPGSNYTTCLMAEFAEQIAITLDSLFGSDHINFFRQSLAHRTGKWTTDPETTPTVLESLQFAQLALNQTFGDLIQVIEQDSWKYQTTRDQGTEIVIGKSMVCCVFVCNMWKAGGIFDSLGSEFTCAEQTLWDIYSMKIYDEDRMNDNRPQICKETDPTNPLCQLMGDITMHLVPDVNTRPLYPNMGERCAALPPQYIRPYNC
eukprot:GILI01010688.1.p1 GENE.GILI01010688.1~~GILI01010688.1.p1  ORF type:complete len:627 (-),score=62.59 GILI01010688.1:126-1850(-)